MDFFSGFRIGSLLIVAFILSACGGGGGGSPSAAPDVLSNYVSSFSYAAPVSRVRAWESYSVTPKVNYIKPNSELTFKLPNSVGGVSINPTSGELTVSAAAEAKGCFEVELLWPKTAESLRSQACVYKEDVGFVFGLSKAGKNSAPVENGEFVFVISKSDPADISFNVVLNYFDTQKFEYVSGGGVFPVGSTTVCVVPATTLPSSITLKQLPQVVDTLVPIEFLIDWTTVAKGEYTYTLQCELKVGLAMVSKTLTQKIRLID